MVDKITQKNECIERLKMLDLHPDVLRLFQEDNRLYYSEKSPLGGILYWVDNNPEWVEMIAKIEEEMGIMVYHATHEHTAFGELLDLLYVSESEEDWEYDREDLHVRGDKVVMAYVLNLSDPAFSEFGSIGIREMAGGLVRIA